MGGLGIYLEGFRGSYNITDLGGKKAVNYFGVIMYIDDTFYSSKDSMILKHKEMRRYCKVFIMQLNLKENND